MNAGAAGDALLMRPVTPGARHAAAETFHKNARFCCTDLEDALKPEAEDFSGCRCHDSCAKAQPMTAEGTEALTSRLSCCTHRTPGARPRRAAAAKKRRHVRTAAAIRRQTLFRSRRTGDSFEFAAGHCESSDVCYCSKRRHRGYLTIYK